MKNILFIRLLDSNPASLLEDEALEYGFYLDDNVLQHSTSASLSSVRSMLEVNPEIKKVVLIVPGEQVFLTSAFVPSRQRKKIQQAIPFVIEEQLVPTLDDLHISILDIAQNKNVSVAVTDHENMQAWTKACQENGFELASIIPETLLAPYKQGAITVLVDDRNSKAYCKLGEYTGLVTSLENIPLVVAGLLESSLQENKNNEIKERININLTDISKNTLDKLSLQCQSMLGDKAGLINTTVESRGTFATLIDNYLQYSDQQKERSNLLKGQYATQQTGARRGLNWQSLAIAASILVLLQAGLNVFSGFYLRSETSSIEAESVALYQELFPEDTRIVNIRTQMENHLNGVGTNITQNGFIQLFGAVSQQLTPGMEIQFVRYNSSEELVTLELKAGTLVQLDELERRLNDEGLRAEITSAAQDSQFVKGRLSVSSKDIAAEG